MDTWSSDRKAEHETHPWQVEVDVEQAVTLGFAPGYLMSCPCGWLGWVAAEAVLITA